MRPNRFAGDHDPEMMRREVDDMLARDRAYQDALDQRDRVTPVNEPLLPLSRQDFERFLCREVPDIDEREGQ